jgi:pimeloyl-ACP methyl ester carboxylesterase
VKEKCKSEFEIPCEYHAIPGAGHWVQQEKPNEVSELILSFLKRKVFVNAKL